MGVIRNFWEGLKLSTWLCLYAVLLLLPVVYMTVMDNVKFALYRDTLQGTSFFEVDYFAGEHIVLFNETLATRMVYVSSGLLQSWGILTFYFPLMAKVYLGDSFPNKIFLIVGLASVFILFGLYGLLGFPVLMFLFTIMLVTLAATLQLTLAKGTRLPWILLEHTLLMAFALIIALFASSSFNTIVRFCVVYPFLREVGRFVGARSSWYLTADANILGDDAKVNREYGWVLSLYSYLFSGIFLRLEVANLEGVSEKTLLIVFQNVLEVAMRTTVMQRDAFLNRFIKCRGVQKGSGKQASVRRSTHIVVPAEDANFRSALEIRLESRKKLYSMLILLEMVSEYVGILVSTYVLIYYHDKILSHPYPAYGYSPDAFSKRPDVGDFLLGGVLQILSEILVDSICIAVENQSGLSLTTVWQQRPSKSFWFWTLSVWYSYILADGAVSTFRDNLSKCVGFDMCQCFGNGLSAGGVREAYCKHLANNSGLP